MPHDSGGDGSNGRLETGLLLLIRSFALILSAGQTIALIALMVRAIGALWLLQRRKEKKEIEKEEKEENERHRISKHSVSSMAFHNARKTEIISNHQFLPKVQFKEALSPV